jgi:hypothetical protein
MKFCNLPVNLNQAAPLRLPMEMTPCGQSQWMLGGSRLWARLAGGRAADCPWLWRYNCRVNAIDAHGRIFAAVIHPLDAWRRDR